MRALFQKMRDMTPEQRHALRDQWHAMTPEQRKAWVEANRRRGRRVRLDRSGAPRRVVLKRSRRAAGHTVFASSSSFQSNASAPSFSSSADEVVDVARVHLAGVQRAHAGQVQRAGDGDAADGRSFRPAA